jgi:hypothetical protein
MDAINFAGHAPMTTITAHWRRQLRTTAKPAYLLLADLIADDIKTGGWACATACPRCASWRATWS